VFQVFVLLARPILLPPPPLEAAGRLLGGCSLLGRRAPSTTEHSPLRFRSSLVGRALGEEAGGRATCAVECEVHNRARLGPLFSSSFHFYFYSYFYFCSASVRPTGCCSPHALCPVPRRRAEDAPQQSAVAEAVARRASRTVGRGRRCNKCAGAVGEFARTHSALCGLQTADCSPHSALLKSALLHCQTPHF